MKAKTKKKIHPALLIALLLLLAAACAAGTAYFKARADKAQLSQAYAEQVRAEVESLVRVSCAGVPLPFESAEFVVFDRDGGETPVSLKGDGEKAAVRLNSFEGDIRFARAPISAAVVVSFEGKEVFRGTPDEYKNDFRPAQDGSYDFVLTAEMENISARGTASYAFTVTYKIEPVFRLSRATAAQGGALVVYGQNLRETDAVAVTVPFAYEPHIARTENGFYAYVPFNFLREPGEYELNVQCNGVDYPLAYTITAVEYDEQHLVVSEETTETTIGDDGALTLYNKTIADLDKLADDEIYWTEAFRWPCEGAITTEFGSRRYINDAAKPSSIHAGVDIACDEGTPVGASNAGRVLYAEFLQVSGWTVVIEHGGGLHTMYLHMSALNCQKGDMVAAGDVIGYVGSTGFATGPHLHFQASVCGACISPDFLLDGSSGVYDVLKYGA